MKTYRSEDRKPEVRGQRSEASGNDSFLKKLKQRLAIFRSARMPSGKYAGQRRPRKKQIVGCENCVRKTKPFSLSKDGTLSRYSYRRAVNRSRCKHGMKSRRRLVASLKAKGMLP